jgi:hypothetical protein
VCKVWSSHLFKSYCTWNTQYKHVLSSLHDNSFRKQCFTLYKNICQLGPALGHFLSASHNSSCLAKQATCIWFQKIDHYFDLICIKLFYASQNFANVKKWTFLRAKIFAKIWFLEFNRAVIDSVQSISTIYRYQVTKINDTPIYR